MEQSVSNQIYIFLFAVIFGLILGVINDIFRFIRYLGFKSKISVFLQDVIYMSICGLLTFLFLLAFNNGEIRYFPLIGEFFGLVIYRYTIGLFTYKLFKFIVSFFRWILLFIKKIIKVILTLLKKIFRPVFGSNSLVRKKLKIFKKNSCNIGSKWCIIRKSVHFFVSFFGRGKNHGNKRSKNRKKEAQA